ncbi:MAG TPA: Mpo1-like protein [Polyangiaceae bacterium]|jgi:hypothetical protein|nr:Mpo1-like protein [Polyangiaceae bacterium]
MTTDGATFDEYWATFVRAHAAPSLRRLSFVAMSAGLATATAFLFTRRALLLLLAPVVAFTPPLMARKLAGDDSSLAAEHPLFFAAASLKMWHLTLTGAMAAEVGRVTASDTPFSPTEGDVFPRPNMVTDHTLH